MRMTTTDEMVPAFHEQRPTKSPQVTTTTTTAAATTTSQISTTVAQAMRQKRLGSLRQIANSQNLNAGGLTNTGNAATTITTSTSISTSAMTQAIQGMASLALSQHTEISYYSSTLDEYTTEFDDDDDVDDNDDDSDENDDQDFCDDSSVSISTYDSDVAAAKIAAANGGSMRRDSSRTSMSSCSAFTLGDLGSIESVSSLECDDVEYEVDDISVERNKKKQGQAIKHRFKEIFCRKPSLTSGTPLLTISTGTGGGGGGGGNTKNTFVRLSSSFGSIGMENRLSDLDEDDNELIDGNDGDDEHDVIEPHEETEEEQQQRKSRFYLLDETDKKLVEALATTSPKRHPRKGREYGSMVEAESSQDLSPTIAAMASIAPRLMHSSSVDLDYDHFPPELDLDRAIELWNELAQGASALKLNNKNNNKKNNKDIDAEYDLPLTGNASSDDYDDTDTENIPKRRFRLSANLGVFTNFTNEELSEIEKSYSKRTTSRESLMSYDFTEVIDVDDDEEEEVLEEEEEEEIIEEIIDDEEAEEVLEEEEEIIEDE